jgi:hypothetical protein
VPPILADDLAGVYFVYCPEVAVSFFVEENSLKDVFIVGQIGRELPLVVATVEAEIEFASVLVLRFDEIHWREVLFGKLVARLLVNVAEGLNCLCGVVFDFVMLFDVIAVVVCDCDVACPFTATENALF